MIRKNILIALVVVLIGGAVVAANLWFKRTPSLTVTTETIKTRDLEAIVSASGKIQPKSQVNISADTPGRVVNLAVDEGYRITKGQFLLQIDPKPLATRVDNSAASLQAAEGSLEEMRQAVQTSTVQLEQLQKALTRQQDLWKRQLTTRETLDQAEDNVRGAQSALKERQRQMTSQDARIQQERANLDSANYDLSKQR